MLPLAVTLAGEAVFDAFAGAGKLDALLHGHSYTAHPVGCAVAAAALDAYADPGANPNLCCPAVRSDVHGSGAGFRVDYLTNGDSCSNAQLTPTMGPRV